MDRGTEVPLTPQGHTPVICRPSIGPHPPQVPCWPPFAHEYLGTDYSKEQCGGVTLHYNILSVVNTIYSKIIH